MTAYARPDVVTLIVADSSLGGPRGALAVDMSEIDQVARLAVELTQSSSCSLSILLAHGAGEGFPRGWGHDLIATSSAVASLIHGVALIDRLEERGLTSRLTSPHPVGAICEELTRDRTREHLRKGRVVVIAGFAPESREAAWFAVAGAVALVEPSLVVTDDRVKPELVDELGIRHIAIRVADPEAADLVHQCLSELDRA